MKDKEKQIEEMAKELERYCNSIECRNGDNCSICTAKWVIGQGYQKIDKIKEVVISREEYFEIEKKKEDLLCKEYGLMKYEKEIKDQERKETVEKIYKDLKLLVPDNALGIVTRYFKEIIGIETKE